MELITRFHKEIKQNTRLTLRSYVRLDKKMLYFSAACNVDLGIVPTLYAHFVNDDDRWFFYINEEKDGFYLTEMNGKNSCAVINTSLSELFKKRTRCSIGCKFPVVATGSKQKDCVLYEIKINEVFE